MFCSERAPHKQAYGNDFILMNQATTSDRLQTTKNTVIEYSNPNENYRTFCISIWIIILL